MTKRLFLLFLGILVVCMLSSCQQSETSHLFSFREQAFRAEITGTLYGTHFSAELGQTEASGERLLYITYLSPPALEGITIERKQNGTCRLHRGEIDTPVGEERTIGLLAPLSLLFGSEEIVRIQKTNGETALFLGNGASLFLDGKGIPLRATSADAELTTVWWETATTK